MKNNPQLNNLRQAIDSLDQDLVKLLNKRASLALQIGKAKKSPTKYSPAREATVLGNALRLNKGPMPNAAIEAIFREVVSSCLNLQLPLRAGFLGPAGTYSEEAAGKQFGSSAELVPLATLEELVRHLETTSLDLAILPIENSTEGSINQTLDLLIQTPATICGEILLPIHHQLLTNAKGLASIKEVLAHPQSLAQCREWLKANLSQAKQTVVLSNGQAAELAAKASNKAAIASVAAAKTYNLPILSPNIEDQAMNTTRFVILGNQSPEATGNDKTSVICSSPHEAGGLLKVLSILADCGVNISKLESRPKPDAHWEYIFFIDMEGHQQDRQLGAALQRLKKANLLFKILGSYPKTEGAS